MRNVSLKIPSTVKEIGKRAFYRRVTPAYGGYLSLIVKPDSYAYDYAKKNALSMDLGETTILYTTCMNGDHDWRVIVDKEPTCTEDGYKSYDCMNKGCNATKRILFLPPVTSWRNIPSMKPIHTREPDTSIV